MRMTVPKSKFDEMVHYLTDQPDCPACGYGAWWATMAKNDAGEYVTCRQTQEAAEKIVRKFCEILDLDV